MPKTEIDYSKAFVYKLVPNDLNIKDCYVGSSTNFNQRKSDHKSVCKNPKNKNHNIPVYKTIREKGGFDAWDMILIENYPCKSKPELLARERYHIEDLEANLNKVIPTRTHKEYYDDNKEIIKEKIGKYREKNKVQIQAYKAQKMDCECGGTYTQNHKSRHLQSKKHIKKCLVLA